MDLSGLDQDIMGCTVMMAMIFLLIGYDPDDERSLSENSVRALAEDMDGISASARLLD